MRVLGIRRAAQQFGLFAASFTEWLWIAYRRPGRLHQGRTVVHGVHVTDWRQVFIVTETINSYVYDTVSKPYRFISAFSICSKSKCKKIKGLTIKKLKQKSNREESGQSVKGVHAVGVYGANDLWKRRFNSGVRKSRNGHKGRKVSSDKR